MVLEDVLPPVLFNQETTLILESDLAARDDASGSLPDGERAGGEEMSRVGGNGELEDLLEESQGIEGQ